MTHITPSVAGDGAAACAATLSPAYSDHSSRVDVGVVDDLLLLAADRTSTVITVKARRQSERKSDRLHLLSVLQLQRTLNAIVADRFRPVIDDERVNTSRDHTRMLSGDLQLRH